MGSYQSTGLKLHGGPARDLPDDVDHYWLSNEDCGFVTSLAVGTKNNYSFSLPMPAGVDLTTQTIIVHKLEFYYIGESSIQASSIEALDVYMSYLDEELPDDWDGSLDDEVDPIVKAHWAGPMKMGLLEMPAPAAAATEQNLLSYDRETNIGYYPEVAGGLDLLFPLVIQLQNRSRATIVLINGTSSAGSFAGTEKFAMRVWFTVRDLSDDEIASRSQQIAWSRLNS